MTDLLQIVAVAISAALLTIVLELVRRRRLTEEYSVIWIACSAALLLLSLWRDSLHVAAHALGVYYPPAVLILVLILFAFIGSLYFSIVLSRQRQQIERLVEDLALLDADIRKLRESAPSVAPDQVVPGAVRHGRESLEQRRVGSA